MTGFVFLKQTIKDTNTIQNVLEIGGGFGSVLANTIWKLLSSKTAPNNGYKNQQEPTNKSTLSPSGGVVNQYITTG
jgi:hypothetical protein